MDVTLALIADAANISSEGKLNILGRFSQVYTQAFPARHPSMVLVLEMEADPFDAGRQKQIEIVLSDPDGREMSRVSTTVILPEPTTPGPIKPVMILDFRDLTFQKPGPFSFTVKIDGVDAPRTVDFKVIKLNRNQGAQP